MRGGKGRGGRGVKVKEYKRCWEEEEEEVDEDEVRE